MLLDVIVLRETTKYIRENPLPFKRREQEQISNLGQCCFICNQKFTWEDVGTLVLELYCRMGSGMNNYTSFYYRGGQSPCHKIGGNQKAHLSCAGYDGAWVTKKTKK